MASKNCERVRIEISSPATGNVQQKQVVNGFIQPPGPVQVLVLSADNKWRLQKEVRLDGPYWSATCHFGEEAGSPGSYEIVAVSGNSIWDPVVDAIPEELPSSEVVHVRRPALSTAANRRRAS
jgi:hypothetical protein